VRYDSASSSIPIVLWVTYLPAVAAVFAAGCSLLYNPENLSSRGDDGVGGSSDGAIGAETDAGMQPNGDAGVDGPPLPGPLELVKVSPSFVVEGTGAGGGRAAVVIVSGDNISDGASFSIASVQDGGVTRTVPVVARVVSSDHTRAAIAIQVPVLTSLPAGAQVPIHVTATQGSESKMIDVSVHGLDELQLSGDVNAGTLQALYSRAVFTGATHFAGTGPAIVRVTSDITLDATVDVDGRGQTAGAHGCDGGGQAAVGNCGNAGGGGGDSGLGGSAGGGGGFASAGVAGKGNSPGGAGAASGEAMLVTLTTAAGQPGNRGNGGGGGGGALLGGGGAGGGGGGVLELTADGTISVAAAARASAAGGQGTAGGGIGGGNGGGGSGGAIVIRAGAGIAAHTGWIGAPGGPGAGSGNAAAGAGAPGRVRIDSPASIAGMVQAPIPVRGAAWATSTPLVVKTPSVSTSIIGDAGRSYPITLDGAARPTVTTGADGSAAIDLTLASDGIHTLCVLASPAATMQHAEAVRCIQIAYVP